MGREKDTGSVSDFQARVEQIVKASNIKQLADNLKNLEYEKISKLKVQQEIALSGQKISAEQELIAKNMLAEIEKSTNKAYDELIEKTKELRKQAASLAKELQIPNKSGFASINAVKAAIWSEDVSASYAFGGKSNLDAQQERVRKEATARLKDKEVQGMNKVPDLNKIDESYIQDKMLVGLLQAAKYNNNDAEVRESLQKQETALRNYIKFRDAVSKEILNGLDPEIVREIEAAEKVLATSLGKVDTTQSALTSKKHEFQKEKKLTGKDPVGYDFTDEQTDSNNALLEMIEANNLLIATYKRLPIVQKETEAEIIQIKQDSAEKQSNIIDINSKKQLDAYQEVAETTAKYEVKKAEETAEKTVAIKKKAVKSITEAEPEAKSAFDSYKVFQGAGLIQSEIDLQRKKTADKISAEKEYTDWWQVELKKREAKELQAERDSAADRKRIESDYNAWWQNAIRESEQKARDAANNEKFLKQQSDRKSEQLLRDQKAEAAAIERKEQMEKRYLEQKEDRERQHQEKLDAIEKSNQANRAASTAKGALVAGAGMLGVYGAADSIERGMRTGVEFSSNLNLAQAIGGYSDTDVKKLEENALKVSAATKATASELPLLQIELTKLGKAPEEIISSTGSIVKFSSTFQTELAQTAGVAAKSAKIFGVEMPRMLDIMGATFRNTSIKDLGQFEEALASGSAMAKALGYSAEQSIALLATAINNGQKADEASRGLQKLLSQAKNANSEFAKYFGGTANNFDEIIARLNAMTASEKEVALTRMKSGNLTEENAKNLLVILMNSGKEISDLNQKLAGSTGIIEGAYDKSMQSLKNQWDLVTSEIETKVIKAYKDLEPQLLSITKAVQNFFEALSDPDSSAAKMIELVEALTAAITTLTLVSGTLTGVPLLIGKISTALKSLYATMIANPITATIAGIAALGAAVYTFVDSEEELLEKEAQRLEIQKQNNEEAVKAAENNKALTDEFEKLAAKEDKSNIEKDRMKIILGDLKKIYPDIITETGNHALALDQVKVAAEKANKELESLAGVEKIRKRAEVENQIAQQEIKVDDAADKVSERDYDSFRSAQSGLLSSSSRELLARKFKPTEASVLAVDNIIGKMENERLNLVQSGTKGGVGYDGLKEMISDAISYRDELQKLVNAKKELKAINNPSSGSKPEAGSKDNGTDGNAEAEALRLQQAKAIFDLNLLRLKLIADNAKFESDQDMINFDKKRKYIEANYNYQKELLKQPLVDYAEKNPEKKSLLLKEQKQKTAQLDVVRLDDLDKTATDEQLADANTKKSAAMLGQQTDLSKKYQYAVEFENAMFDEKVKLLNLQLSNKQIEKEDYDLQVKLAEVLKEQNIALARRNEIVQGLEKEQIAAEIEKLKSLDLDLDNAEKQITLKYKIEIERLDPKSDNYKENIELLKAKENQEKGISNEKRAKVKTDTELLNLQNRRSDFFEDYSLDRQILDQTYEQKNTEVDQNTNLTPGQKTAQKEKLSKDKSKEQKKILTEEVDYYGQITQKSFGMMKQLSDSHYNQELAKTKKLYDEKAKLLDKEYSQKVKGAQGANRTLAILEAEHEKNKEKLEAEREKRLAEIEKKKQKWAIAEATINIAVAITKALAESSLIGWINAAAATVTGGIQIAQIEAQQFNTGKILVNQSDNPNDRILAWIGQDESIINPESSRANAPVLNEINNAHGEWTPKTPSVQRFIINTDNSQLIAEIRQMRAEAGNHAKSISGSVDSKDWSVKIHNENKGFDPRTVSQTVKKGNDKTAKLTILNN